MSRQRRLAEAHENALERLLVIELLMASERQRPSTLSATTSIHSFKVSQPRNLAAVARLLGGPLEMPP